jgi:L-ribulose-5-phosphate 3-epimerase
VFRLAYNTNGLAHHRPLEALALLADLGYEGVALTPDVGQLDPYRLDAREVEALRARAEDLGLELALETGARFLLDPALKHRPNLLDPEPEARARRVDFHRRCLDLARELGAPLVSLWAGAAPDGRRGDEGGGPELEVLWGRLVDGLRRTLDLAEERGVALAFEPEPGMFIERPAGWRELRRRLGPEGPRLGLTLDVGHLLCTGDLPVPDQVRALAPDLVHVHLDDIRGGVHEHLPFGQGDLDLPGTLGALLEVGYRGLAAVELSRDSHRGPHAARDALTRLRAALGPSAGRAAPPGP